MKTGKYYSGFLPSPDGVRTMAVMWRHCNAMKDKCLFILNIQIGISVCLYNQYGINKLFVQHHHIGQRSLFMEIDGRRLRWIYQCEYFFTNLKWNPCVALIHHLYRKSTSFIDFKLIYSKYRLILQKSDRVLVFQIKMMCNSTLKICIPVTYSVLLVFMICNIRRELKYVVKDNVLLGAAKTKFRVESSRYWPECFLTEGSGWVISILIHYKDYVAYCIDM